jgi:hypothetical protein
LIVRLQKGKRNGRRLVSEYFERIQAGDLRGLLSLFSDDSIIFEPFSKTKFLSGRLEIEPFLETVILANKGMQESLLSSHFIKVDQLLPGTLFSYTTIVKRGGVQSKRWTLNS